MNQFKNGIIFLDFIGINKDGTYVYYNPTVEPPKVKSKNNNPKSIFDFIFNKKK